MSYRKSHLNDALSFMRDRAAETVVSRTRAKKTAFNDVLRKLVETDIIKEPVFEAAKLWRHADESYKELAQKELIDETFLKALSRSKTASEFISFDKFPYTHQLEAFRAAKADKSFIVTSGTGSGKTETFMLPVISDIVARIKQNGNKPGIQAIIIYPLNALIESQRKRLKDWLDALDKEGITVKYALYNGLTPESTLGGTKEEKFGKTECRSRAEIRKEKPAILITNITMLEYMLLRPKDQRLIKDSYGGLRWIVLDEAHSYVGSQAAELAMLLRRIRIAFGVKSTDTKIIATSATVGSGAESNAALAKFIGDLAGYDATDINSKTTVIHGQVLFPDLPDPTRTDLPTLSDLSDLTPEELWDRCIASSKTQDLIRSFREKNCSFSLSEVGEKLFGDASRKEESLRWLEILAQATKDGKKLLPWRSHVFHRSIDGVSACIDPQCAKKQTDLKTEQWGWGKVYLGQREKCECGTLCLSVGVCRDCNSLYLMGNEENCGKGILYLRSDLHADQPADRETEDEDNPDISTAFGSRVLIPDPCPPTSYSGDCREKKFLIPENNRLLSSKKPKSISLTYTKDTACFCKFYAKQGSNRRGDVKRIFLGPQSFIPEELPNILEFLGKNDFDKQLPLDGKRGLTFTDSRQGVAKMAHFLQTDAEKRLIRSFVYHFINFSTPISDEEKRKLQTYKNMSTEDQNTFKKDIEKLEQKLNAEPLPQKFEEVVNKFKQFDDLDKALLPLWKNRLIRVLGPNETNAFLSQGHEKFTETVLLKEFIRRPAGAKQNLETFGGARLVFPKLEDAIGSNVVGHEGKRLPAIKGIESKDWIDLAYAGIDLIFRSRCAVKTPDGENIIRLLVPSLKKEERYVSNSADQPDREHNNQLDWPRATQDTHYNRVINRFLEERGIPQIRAQEILETVWKLIKFNCASTKTDDPYLCQLDFSKYAALAPVSTGWICPQTGKITSYLVGSFSPWDQTDDPTPPEAVEIPRAECISSSAPLTPENRQRNIEWFKTNPGVQKLRRRLVWNQDVEKFIAYARYYRSQEHSAQISRVSLEEYEKHFDKGLINFLNCSTTMEMGIDLADVSIVANTNVPPSIANYRQRVGRAGRRGEEWAFGFTWCRPNPFDEAAFNKPRHYLSQESAPPSIYLSSERLLKRHVQSLILGLFLQEITEGRSQSLGTTIGDFMGVPEEVTSKTSKQEKNDILDRWKRGDFSSNAKKFRKKLKDPAFIEAQGPALKSLVQGTPLGLKNDREIFDEVHETFEEFYAKWFEDHKKLRNELQKALSDDTIESRYVNLLCIQLKQMANENMVTALAQGDFLPAYGFPIGICPLTFPTWEESPLPKNAKKRVDNFQRITGIAQRPADIAIREYAPGMKTVIDGLSYVSEGIKPAWTQDASVDKIEDIRQARVCTNCAAIKVARNFSGTEKCEECHSLLEVSEQKRILRPKGFTATAAAISEESESYIPFPQVNFSLSGRFIDIGAGGKYRADKQGQSHLISSGRSGLGYALCLQCGRMKHMTRNSEGEPKNPKDILKGHKPLELRVLSISNNCPGNDDESSATVVHLSAHNTTSVFEYHLPVNDITDTGAMPEIALAVGSAFREALCAYLGVLTDEIGVGVRSKGTDTRFVLYDNADGGAGLSTQLGRRELFNRVLKDCVKYLNCPHECDSGCPSCFMRNDIAQNKLKPKRKDALQLVEKIQQTMVLNDKDRLFGESSLKAGDDPITWLGHFAEQESFQKVRIFVERDLPNFDDFKPLARILESRGVVIELVFSSIDDEAYESIDSLLYLSDLEKSLGIKTYTANEYPTTPIGERPVLIQAKNLQDEWIALASLNQENLSWTEEQTLIQGNMLCSDHYGDKMDLSIDRIKKLAEKQGVQAEVLEVGEELDGDIRRFGNLFWKTVSDALPSFGETLQNASFDKITYTDKYVRSPLTVALLYRVLRSIPGMTEEEWPEVTAKIVFHFDEFERTSPPYSPKPYHNWEDPSDRENVMKDLFPNAQFNYADLLHDRRLELVLSSGETLLIVLGQGMGAWRLDPPKPYNFNATPRAQSAAIARAIWGVRNGEKMTTLTLKIKPV